MIETDSKEVAFTDRQNAQLVVVAVLLVGGFGLTFGSSEHAFEACGIVMVALGLTILVLGDFINSETRAPE